MREAFEAHPERPSSWFVATFEWGIRLATVARHRVRLVGRRAQEGQTAGVPQRVPDEVLLEAFQVHPEWPAHRFVTEYGWPISEVSVARHRRLLTGPRRPGPKLGTPRPPRPPFPAEKRHGGRYDNEWNAKNFAGFGKIRCGICDAPVLEHRIGRCPELDDMVSLRGVGPKQRESR